MKNKHFRFLCLVAVLAIPCGAALVTLDLAGQWEAAAGRYGDSLWSGTASSYGLKWVAAPVPGSWSDIAGLMEGAEGPAAGRADALPCVWYRTRFAVPKNCIGMQSALRLLGARWEVSVWLNGEKIGTELSGYGVLEFNLSRAVKAEGENVLVVRTGGWSTLPKSAAQAVPLFPSSSGPHWGPKQGAIQRGAELAFFHDGRINKIKIDPVLSASSVIARAEIENITMFHGRQKLIWTVSEKKSGKYLARGEVDIPYHHSLKLKGNPAFYNVAIKLPGFRKWSLEDPFLYTAGAHLFLEGRAADSLRADFGMREFRVKEGNFELNRKPVYLRGGNLFGHDAWIGTPEARRNPAKIKAFLVDGAKDFGFNCVRTHTHPMAEAWNRSADENGLLVVSEMTLIVNGSGWILTPEERKVFRENVIREYGRILPEVWNHPSTIMWSISNESYWPDNGDWDAWELGPLTDWFSAQDSTRPVIRAGSSSRDVLDNHIFDGWWTGVEGDFLDYVRGVAGAEAKEPRPVTVSEFMQFSPYTAAKWLGPSVVPDPDKGDWGYFSRPEAMNFHAQLAMEYVECMRVNGIRMILPYLFPDNGAMRPERMAVGPVYSALKNAYSPQLCCMDLFNRHYAVKSKIKVPVSFAGDYQSDKQVRITLRLARDNPGFVVDRLDLSSMMNMDEKTVKAFSAGAKPLTLDAVLPDKPGSYWLVLSTPGAESETPIISRREVKVYKTAGPLPKGAGYLGFPDALQFHLKKSGFSILRDAGTRPSDLPHVLVIGPDFLGREALESEKQKALSAFVENGGRILFLEQTRWLYPEWVNLKIERMAKNGSGAAFFERDGAAEKVLTGLTEGDFYRFNGPPGDVVTHRITDIRDTRCGSLMRAQDGWKTLWESVCLAEAGIGKGKILFCQLSLSKRLDPADADYYDPVCAAAFNRMVEYLQR